MCPFDFHKMLLEMCDKKININCAALTVFPTNMWANWFTDKSPIFSTKSGQIIQNMGKFNKLFVEDFQKSNANFQARFAMAFILDTLLTKCPISTCISSPNCLSDMFYILFLKINKIFTFLSKTSSVDKEQQPKLWQNENVSHKTIHLVWLWDSDM